VRHVFVAKQSFRYFDAGYCKIKKHKTAVISSD